MQAKAVGGFSEGAVDAAIKGANWPRKYRIRAAVVNKYGESIRTLTGLQLSGSHVGRNATQDVRQFASLVISETDIVIDDWATVVLSYAPLVLWQCGETAGATTIADASGQGRTLSLTGGYTLAKASLLAGYQTNTAITFNGSTGYGSIADAAWMDVSAITIALWWQGTGANQCLVDRDDGGANRFWRLEVDSSGYLAFTVKFTSGGTNPQTYTASVAAINDGKPHFICAVYDQSHVILEVDGIGILRTAETRTMATGALGIRIGATNAATHFSSGTFDEIALWDRALSAQERRDAFQTGDGDLAEIDYTHDQIQIWGAVGMVAEPDRTKDADWAEWSLGVFVPTIPARDRQETQIVRTIAAQDRTIILKNKKFRSRANGTILSGANFITGTLGVIELAQAAGFDTAGWSVTTTSLSAVTTFDFPIGSSYLDAINYLLKAAGYRPIRFRGDGQAVIEPIIQPAARSIEDTLTDDDVSEIGVEQGEQIDLSKGFNIVVWYKNNPDGTTFLYTEQTNTNWDSPVSIQRIGENPAPPVQVDAGDQNSLETGAKFDLNQFAQIALRITYKTVARFFEDDEDCYQLNFVNATPSLGTTGKTVEESWDLPLDIGMGDEILMTHVARAAFDIVT